MDPLNLFDLDLDPANLELGSSPISFDSPFLTNPSETDSTYKSDSVGSPEMLGEGNSHRSFTNEEDDIIRHMASELSFDWPRIARLLSNKTPAQVAKRYTCKLDPNIKKAKWSAEEDFIIAELQRLHGNNWKLIAKSLPGRPPLAIKSRYYNRIKKKEDLKTVLGTQYLRGCQGDRNLTQMKLPLGACSDMVQPGGLKEERITTLRKELASMEVLMSKTKAELSRLLKKTEH